MSALSRASACCGLAALAVVAGASTSTSASLRQVVDRTLTCSPKAANGARTIDVRAQSAHRRGARLEWLAQAVVTTAGNPVPARRNEYRPTLVGVTAGWPPPPPLASGGLGIDVQRCNASRRSVPLSRRGLRGGAASVLGEETECYAPAAILIRVRAVFRSTAALELDPKRNWLAADGRIERAQIAVRTPQGRTLVYAEVAESGAARLFTDRGCF